MKTTSKKKLTLRRETLRTLATNQLAQVGGGVLGPPPIPTQPGTLQQFTSPYNTYSCGASLGGGSM
jgi:hypothetical protein